MLITAIASCQIKAGNLGSRPNYTKYSEKDERKTCYNSCNNRASYKIHGSYESHSQVWPLWRSYFCKLGFTIYTIHLTNPFASRWFIKSCDDQVFSHTTLGIPHRILCLGQWNLWLEHQTYQIPCPKMHMLPFHWYNLATEPTPTTWKNA